MSHSGQALPFANAGAAVGEWLLPSRAGRPAAKAGLPWLRRCGGAAIRSKPRRMIPHLRCRCAPSSSWSVPTKLVRQACGHVHTVDAVCVSAAMVCRRRRRRRLPPTRSRTSRRCRSHARRHVGADDRLETGVLQRYAHVQRRASCSYRYAPLRLRRGGQMPNELPQNRECRSSSGKVRMRQRQVDAVASTALLPNP